MKIIKINIQKLEPNLLLLFISILLINLYACKKDNKQENNVQTEAQVDNSIVVITEAMDFQTLDTIPSGWNTFKWSNNSPEVHLFLLDKYPAGKDVSDAIKLAVDFQKGMDLINEGKPDEANVEFGKLPEWFGEIVFSGGSGLLSPEETSITTLDLKPGYYVMECYVKMANGVFHTVMGMAKGIVVTDENSGNSALQASVNIVVSSENGITYDNIIKSGEQVLSVTFNDQIVHENFLGHDVNLVKLDKNANLEDLENWVNWLTPTGLRTPSPEGITFLGGVNDSPAGSVGYFEVTLTPGDYAFISEVPDASSKKMLKTFTVQ
jgi:hypothetical protein